MAPAFSLPRPWVHVDYRALAGALTKIDADALGSMGDQFTHYRALLRRLVALAEAVDPRQAPREPFAVTDDVVKQLHASGLGGAIARTRCSALAEAVQVRLDKPK